MSVTKPVHAPMVNWRVADGCLQVNGLSLTRLAVRVGQTPFFAYDRELLRQKVAVLRQHIPAEIHLHYAMKANPMPVLVQFMAGLVDGLDVASGNELRIALDSGTNPERISFAGPGKSERELTSAIAAGITINLESPREMETAAALGRSLGIKPRVAVRVNPDYELKSSGMKMGGGPKQFGVDAETVPELLRRMKDLPLDFQGFHIYSGSQNLRAESLQEAQEKTLELAYRLQEDAPIPVRSLNIGGGFGIPYFPGETALDIAAVGENLRRLLPEATRRMPHAQLVIELGRYLVGEAGIYVCRIVDRKISRGHVFLVTDGGLHHQLAASGNFGQVIRKNYPVAIGNRMDADATENASVVGPLCTPLDLLGDKMQLPRADVGDFVVVFQSGAYGLTASPTAFLSHPAPLEVLV
jgi:diaminopimelate decarboxylase